MTSANVTQSSLVQKTADQPRCEILLDDVKLFSEVFKHDSSRTRAILVLTASCSHRSLPSRWRLLAAGEQQDGALLPPTVVECGQNVLKINKINHIEQTTEHGLMSFTSELLSCLFYCGEKAATTTQSISSVSHIIFTLICDTLKWFPRFLYQPVGQFSFPSP